MLCAIGTVLWLTRSVLGRRQAMRRGSDGIAWLNDGQASVHGSFIASEQILWLIHTKENCGGVTTNRTVIHMTS